MIFGGNRALLAVTVGALVVSLTGCVNFGGPADPASGGMLECERRGEPCTLAEASPEALALTRVITGVAADYLGAGVEPRVVAAEVAMVPGVVETGSDELGVFFRVENAPPAWVMLDELDGNPVMGGWFGAAPTGSAAATVANPIAVNRPVVIPTTMAPTVVSPAARTETQAGGGGIAGTPGEGKHALVLSPWGFEMTNEVGARLAADRDFSERGGSVTTLLWDEPIDPVSAIGAFQGWEAFDTIVLATHGIGVCEEGEDGTLLRDAEGNFVGCRTLLTAGPVKGTLEEATAAIGHIPGVVLAERTTRYPVDWSVEELVQHLREVCIPLIEEYPSADMIAPCREPIPDDEERPVEVALTADFFRTQYPGGVPNSVIALMACHSMRFTDIASALQAGSGVVLGYPQVVWSTHAMKVQGELLTSLLRGLPVADALAENAKSHTLGVVGAPVLRHVGNELVRSRDIVALLSGQSELRDGATVPLSETAGGDPATELVVRVSRVGAEESADQFRPEVWVDGELAVRDVALESEVDGEWFSATVQVPLPEGYEPGDRFTAEVRTMLPAGGESRWRYEDLRAEVMVRYTSHVTYVFPTHRGEGVMVAEGPLDSGPDGWQASLPMRWESVTVTGLPPQCSLGELSAVTQFVVRDGGLEGDGAVLRWSVDLGGDGTEIRDTIRIDCAGLGSQFGDAFAQGMGAALGVAGMIVAHGANGQAGVWTANQFVPSSSPGVQLVHEHRGTEGEITSVVTIELLGGG